MCSSIIFVVVAAFTLFATTTYCASVPGEVKSNPPTSSVVVTDTYVPHATFPYADTYPNSGYDNYLLPLAGVNYPQVSSMMPSAAQSALRLALRIFAKIGLFLVGGVTLLVVGGIFTKLVCSVVPICAVTFAGMQNLDKDTMRSFVTPDKISQAAEFVHDAIGKYQRFQRAIGN